MQSPATSRPTRRHRRITPYAWLGAGAVTLGIGAAALAGAGLAVTEDTGSDSPSASPSTSSREPDDADGAGDPSASPTEKDPNSADDSHAATEAAVSDVDEDEAAAVEDGEADVEQDVDVEGEETSPETQSIESPAQSDADIEDTPAAALLPLSSVSRRQTVPTEQSTTVDVAAQSEVVETAAASIDPNVSAVVKTGAYFPESVAASPDGRYVYAGTGTMNLASGSVVVIDAATNTVKKTITTNFVVTGIAVAPNGRVYAAGFRTVGELSAVGVVAAISSSHTVSKTINLGAATSYSMPVAVTPDGKSVVIGWGRPTSYGVGYAGALTTISTSTQRVTRTVSFDGSVADIAVTPDSKTALVAVNDTYPATLLKVDLASGAATAIGPDPTTADVRSVAVMPGGVFAFVALDNSGDDIAIVHIGSGDVLASFDAGQASNAEQIRLSPDGKLLFAVEDNVMYTVDIKSRTTLHTLTVGPGTHFYSSDVAVSRNGKVYLSTLYDNSVAVVKMYAANAARSCR